MKWGQQTAWAATSMILESVWNADLKKNPFDCNTPRSILNLQNLHYFTTIIQALINLLLCCPTVAAGFGFLPGFFVGQGCILHHCWVSLTRVVPLRDEIQGHIVLPNYCIDSEAWRPYSRILFNSSPEQNLLDFLSCNVINTLFNSDYDAMQG